MSSMERQKDMTLEDEPPRSVDIQYATGEEQRNSSRRMKRLGQSEIDTELWMCPFKYDLNQIPDEYTVEETTRFKGLDLEKKSVSQDHPHSQSQGQALIQGSWTSRSYPFLSREHTWVVYSPPGWKVP